MHSVGRHGLKRGIPIRDVCVPKLRVGSNGCCGMARDVNLRQDLDVQRCSIGDNVLDLLGCVSLRDTGGVLGSHFHKEWILLDREPPALVIGEMPVEAVQLEGRHGVEKLLHLPSREEVTTHVEMDATPTEARLILDEKGGQLGVRTLRGELHESLHTVKEAHRCLCDDLHHVFRHREPVALWVQLFLCCLLQAQGNGAPTASALRLLHPSSGHRHHVLAQGHKGEVLV
mmetsp:Transcript_22314/g.47523  ORF Transcript_22314/g.47523 Transcript_22314/m.47523 type:complete len:229 (+) Transcript_22314:741-1427(+)